MRRSSFVSAVVAVALLGVGAPAIAAPAVPREAVHHAPTPVSRVRAYDERSAVRVTWVNPSGRDFDHVVVRYQRGPIAPKRHRGTYDGKRVHLGDHASSATLTHLSRDTAFAVSIWTVSAHGRQSAARHVRFTTGGGHVAHGRYTARFTDSTNHPLAGVVATAESYTGSGHRTVTSARNGRIAVRLPAGRYLIDTDATHATGGAADPTGYVGTERFVTVDAGRTLSAGSVVLRSGGTVHVHVTDPTGRPVSGAHAELTPVSPYVQLEIGGNYSVPSSYFDGADPLGTARTDADGNATLIGVPTGSAFQVCVNPYSYAGLSDSRFRSACTSSAGLARRGGVVSTAALVVRRTGAAGGGATIAGTVRSRDGRGHGTSYVFVEHGRHTVAAVPTQRDGRFRAGGIAPGTYRVCASDGTLAYAGRTGYGPACAAHPVTVGNNTAVASTAIVRPVAAAVTGTVTGPNGVAVPGVFATVSRSDDQGFAVTDSEGHFIVKGLSAGRHSLCVMTFGYEGDKALPFGVRGACGKHRVHFTAGPGLVRTGLDARLRAGAAIAGTVVDRRGRPVPFAEVSIGPRHDRVGGVTYENLADSHGRFAFDGLRSARYKLCATNLPGPAGSGGLAALDSFDTYDVASVCHHPDITLRTGHRRRAIRIVLPTTAAVRATAVDEHGRGVAGVDAAVIAPCHGLCNTGTSLLPRHQTAVAASGVTGAHGTVLLDGLRPGKYTVCLFAYYGTTRAGAPPAGYTDRCTGSTFSVVVRAAHTTVKRVVLHPAGAVSGRITDSAGHPLQGVVVHVQGSAAKDLPANDIEFETSFEDANGGASAPPGYFSTTDAEGDYTVRSVHPGDRLVCATATGVSDDAGTGYLSQCVGGSVGSTKKGAPVTVRSGTTTNGVDLALSPAASITGTVTSLLSSADTVVVLFRGDTYVSQVSATKKGAYRFGRMAPGTYTVCAASFTRTKAGGRCYRDAAWDPQTAEGPATDATPVQAAAGVTTTGIDLTVPK